MKNHGKIGKNLVIQMDHKVIIMNNRKKFFLYFLCIKIYNIWPFEKLSDLTLCRIFFLWFEDTSHNSLLVKLTVVRGWGKWKVRKEFAFKFLTFFKCGPPQISGCWCCVVWGTKLSYVSTWNELRLAWKS